MKATDIEKTITFELSGYRVIIRRNRRKDCFLSIEIVNPEPFEKPQVYICGGLQVHLTLRSAKETAVKIIKSFTQH